MTVINSINNTLTNYNQVGNCQTNIIFSNGSKVKTNSSSNFNNFLLSSYSTSESLNKTFFTFVNNGGNIPNLLINSLDGTSASIDNTIIGSITPNSGIFSNASFYSMTIGSILLNNFGVTTNSSILSKDSIGYANGAGSSVTVIDLNGSINAICGTIIISYGNVLTWFNPGFNISNDKVSQNDSIILTIKSGDPGVEIIIGSVFDGSFFIKTTSIPSSPILPVTLNFTVIKSVSS